VAASLRLGERVLVRSDEGPLAAEYAIYDTSDIILQATDPLTVREAGYVTTAGQALERLARAGVTPALATDAAQALSVAVAASFARGRSARAVVSQLGAHELFDGALYNSLGRRYEGAWLDLRALTTALGIEHAPLLLQALHLAAALSEVAPSTPVLLSTAAITRDRRPGERTHAPVPLDGAAALPDALARLGPASRATEVTNDRLLQQALYARVRERTGPDVSPTLRAHLVRLEAALSVHNAPLGPLDDPDLRTLEQQLANGDASGVTDRLDGLQRTHGATLGVRYLRARASLVSGDQPPRTVAESLSDIACAEPTFHEAALAAARAWLAAGENVHARQFARRVAEDASASDGVRLIALELLDASVETGESQVPPSAAPATARTGSSGTPRRYPSLGEVPPPASSVPPASIAPPPAAPEPRVTVVPPLPGAAAPFAPGPTPVPPRPGGDLAESWPLPQGLDEGMLGPSELPRTPDQARIAMTRLSRDIGRDYRLWYGKTLGCDAASLEIVQQHLMHRYAGARPADPVVVWELRRHGAYLSEILARSLGSAWVDVSASEPGEWTMLVPPSTKSCPIGKVYRFVALGQRGRDLVGYYLDLASQARVARRA
jgi:hypothetical protein